MSEMVFTGNTSSSIDSLPAAWKIPIAQMELRVNENSEAIVLGKGAFGLVRFMIQKPMNIKPREIPARAMIVVVPSITQCA